MARPPEKGLFYFMCGMFSRFFLLFPAFFGSVHGTSLSRALFPRNGRKKRIMCLCALCVFARSRTLCPWFVWVSIRDFFKSRTYRGAMKNGIFLTKIEGLGRVCTERCRWKWQNKKIRSTNLCVILICFFFEKILCTKSKESIIVL